MKRLLILLTLLVSLATAFADELSDSVNDFGKTLTAIITKETNGYVAEEIANDYVYSAFVHVPDYYDNDLIIAIINPIVDDAMFQTVKPWTAVEDGVISSYTLGDAAKINFRFDYIRHQIVIVLQALR